MQRVLVIDQDRDAVTALGLGCLERRIPVVIADSLCEGVRELLETPVSVIAVDVALLRLTPRETAALFERVAPGVSVIVVLRGAAAPDTTAAYERAGFHVVKGSITVEDVVDALAVSEVA